MKLKSKRLLKIAECIKNYKKGNILADIGTDHAYLPCFLFKEKAISHAYACDVAEGPLHSSMATIAQEEVEGHVIPLLGDGLAPIVDKDVDMISICGMGGLLMTQILDRHPEKMETARFFLQANTAIDLLREYLMKHDMRIIYEDVVKDAHHIYEIIIVEKGKDVSYTKEELIFGPVLMKKKDPLFIEKWQKQLVSQSNILKGLPQTNEKYQEVKDMVDLIKKVIE